MSKKYRMRRAVMAFVALIGIVAAAVQVPELWQMQATDQSEVAEAPGSAAGPAVDVLKTLPVKGKAPKTGYSRTQFGDGWKIVRGCDTRNIILNRDMRDVVIGDGCKVMRGTLSDPYTGQTITFERGPSTSDKVQIDHVVALSNAWQTGAQQLTAEEREQLANDPLELLAVDGGENQNKSDGDAATWLPPSKAFRCQYVARQIAVKQKYRLWVIPAEAEAMQRILGGCPGQALPRAD